MALLFAVLLGGALFGGAFLLLALSFALRHFFGATGAWIGAGLLAAAGAFLILWTASMLLDPVQNASRDNALIARWYAVATGVPALLCAGFALWLARLALQKSGG